MRKKHFNLTVTSALATSLAGCGPSANYGYDDVNTFADRDTVVCIDRQRQVRVDDIHCRSSTGSSWYYIGRNHAIPYYGDRAVGGGYVRPSGPVYFAPRSTAVTRSIAVSRGGWGSSARSSGFHASS